MKWENPINLVIVAEDSNPARRLSELLGPEGFNTAPVRSFPDAAKYIHRHSADLLLLILDGEEPLLLKELTKLIRETPGVRVVAAVSEALEGYEEMLGESGIHQVLSCSLEPRQIVQFLVTQREIMQLDRQNLHLRQLVDGRSSYENLIGSSAPMRAIYRLIEQIARTDAPVLITGEEGTEKLEVARAIHQKSNRALQPMVAVDCMDASDDPEGKALFGPMGAGEYSTGPSIGHSAFAKAGKGTIVIDHIETMATPTQRRLLDFLHRPFFQNETPGSPQPLARIMVTAGPNLLSQVEAGRFERELFYRLNILQVRVPPLRERREDIPLLALHYLRDGNKGGGARSGKGTLTFASRTLLYLFQYEWPGNVTELKESVLDMAHGAEETQIEVTQLPEAIREACDPSEEVAAAEKNRDLPLKEAKRHFESEYFKNLLRRTRGNMAKASRYSHVGRPYLYKKIREHGIEPEHFR